MWARSAAGDGNDICLELPLRPVTPGKTCRVIRVRGWGSSGSTYLHNMLLDLAPKGVKVGKDHTLEAATWDACTVVPVRDFRDILCSAIKRLLNCFNCTAEEVEQLIVERYDETIGAEGDKSGLVYPMRDFFELMFAHKDKFVSLPYEGFAGSTCSWQLLAWMNAQFGWRVSPAAFMYAERRHSLETTAKKLRDLQSKLLKDRPELLKHGVSRKEGLFKAGGTAIRDSKQFGVGIHAHHISNNGQSGVWRRCFTPSRLGMLHQELRPLLTKFYGQAW